MKIVYIANIRLPTEKAHGIQIMNMCNAFASLGHEVTLIVPARNSHITADPFEYYDVLKRFSIIRTWTLDTVSWGRFGFLLQSFTFLLSSVYVTHHLRPLLVYGRDELILSCISRFAPVVWETHTGAHNKAVAYLLSKGTKIVAITQGLKNFYVEQGASTDSILVAHDAVDLDRFRAVDSSTALRQRYAIADNAMVVGYVGKYKTVGHSKGLDELIEAFFENTKTSSHLHLLIVGPDADETVMIEGFTKRVGLSKEEYTIVSHVKSQEVPGYLSVCDILVMNYPAVAHFSKFMSPLKLFEYMASGKAIIASDLPSIREVVSEKEVYFVRPENHEDLVKAIEILSTSRDYRIRIGSAVRELSQKYSWSSRARSILLFLQ